MLSSNRVIAMYNQEIKERFLAECNQKSAYSTTRPKLFDNISVFEESLSKDLGEMSREEAVLAVNFLEPVEYGTATTALTTLKVYARWCSEQDLFPGSSYALGSLTIDDIDATLALSKMLFRDDKDFVDTIRSTISLHDGYVAPVYLAFAWLGVDQKYALTVKDAAVDLRNRVVHDESGNIVVDGFSDAIHYVLESFVKCNLSTRENGSSTTEVIKDRSVDQFIKRFHPRVSEEFGEPINETQIQSAVTRLNRSHGEREQKSRFTYSNVQESGALYRVFQLEQSGVDVFAKKNIHLVQKAYKKPKPYHKIIWKYKFYKKAFDL